MKSEYLIFVFSNFFERNKYDIHERNNKRYLP